MHLDTLSYHGWQATRLRTSALEVVFPHAVGPRLVHLSRPGSKNLFAEMPEQLGQQGEKEWMIRGGHRLWIAPEDKPRTYEPDNDAIELKPSGTALELVQATGAHTRIQKTLRLEEVGQGSLKVTHRLRNANSWPVELAAWALSVMRHDSYVVLPMLPFRAHTEHLLPVSHLVLWGYTNLGHPAWQWRNGRLGVDVSKAAESQKVGLADYPGWMACWTPEGTFVKYSPTCPGSRYTDDGAMAEIYHCDWMVELETLSPLTMLEPQESLEHVEYWTVVPDLPKPDTDAGYQQLKTVVEGWLAKASLK